MYFLDDDDERPASPLDPTHQPLLDALSAIERLSRSPQPQTATRAEALPIADARALLTLLRDDPRALPHPGDELDGVLYEARQAISALWRRVVEALVFIIERAEDVALLREASVALLCHTTQLDWATKGLPQARLLTRLLGRARDPDAALTLPMLALLKLIMPDDTYALKLVVQRFRGEGDDDPIRAHHLVELVELWPRLADSPSGAVFLKTSLACLLGDLPPEALSAHIEALAETIRSSDTPHRFARLPDTFLRRETYRRPPLLDAMLDLLAAVAALPEPDDAQRHDPTARMGLIIAAWPALHQELGEVGRQELPSRHVFLGSVHQDPMGDHLSELWDLLWRELGGEAVGDSALLELIEGALRTTQPPPPQTANALAELLAHVAPRLALYDVRHLRRLIRALDALPGPLARPLLDAHLELHEAAQLWHSWADEGFQPRILALIAARFGELEIHEAVREIDALMEDARDWQPHQLRTLGAWPGALLDVHEPHPDLDHVLVELTCRIPNPQAEPAMMTILRRTHVARTQALILGWLADHGTAQTAGELHRWGNHPPQRDDRALKKALTHAITHITARAGQSGGLSVMDDRQGALSEAPLPSPAPSAAPPNPLSSHDLTHAANQALQQHAPNVMLPILGALALLVAAGIIYALALVFL